MRTKLSYTYWIIYSKETGEIYGWTDTKEYAKRFMKERDKHKFLCNKMELSKEDIRHLDNNNLEKVWLKTFIGRSEGAVELVLTNWERITLVQQTSVMCTYKYITSTWHTPYLFNRKVFKAFETLGYVIGNRYIETGEDEAGREIDELGVFLKLYGHTM